MDAISFESYKIRQSLIEGAQDKIFFENISGSEKSKKSGYEIAQETFKLSKLMNEGLSKISDESERKQKSDEYYLLLNMIDFLEDNPHYLEIMKKQRFLVGKKRIQILSDIVII